MNELKKLLPLLCCPDDQSPMEYRFPYLVCTRCKKKHTIHGENFIELMPKSTQFHHKQNPGYQSYYQREFNRKFTWIKEAKAWGRIDLNPASWAKKRMRQVEFVKQRLVKTAIVCDVSAGAGNYTFDLAKQFDLVIHCDLSVINLNDVYCRAQAQKVKNLVLIRCDYFKLPFKNSIDQLICLDTLVRGESHEKRLLSSLLSAVSPQGTIMADFHNWWHNPLRRMGLMPQNFDTSYTRKQTERLLDRAGITDRHYYPFHQEFSPDSASVLKLAIPPTRFVYQLKKI